MAELKKQAAAGGSSSRGVSPQRYRADLKKEIPEIDAIYGTG